MLEFDDREDIGGEFSRGVRRSMSDELTPHLRNVFSKAVQSQV